MVIFSGHVASHSHPTLQGWHPNNPWLPNMDPVGGSNPPAREQLQLPGLMEPGSLVGTVM